MSGKLQGMNGKLYLTRSVAVNSFLEDQITSRCDITILILRNFKLMNVKKFPKGLANVLEKCQPNPVENEQLVRFRVHKKNN